MRTLAGRYSLEDCVLDGPHWSYWRGHDGILRRSVGILVVERSDELEADVLSAARDSSAAEDPRLLRVLDVLTDSEASGSDDAGGSGGGSGSGSEGTALVIEWLTAESLEDVLADGALPDLEAWRMTLDVAQALAAAQVHGLGHGVLAPRWVLRGEAGRVRLLGLSVAAALHGVESSGEELAERDAHGLGALLYACLTARWPGAEPDCALARAPHQSGHAVRPRMVRAGVPVALDDVAARALGLPGRGEPLRSPADVAAALELAGERMKGFDLTDDTNQVDERPVAATGAGRRRRSRALVAALCVVALLVVPAYLGLRSLGGPARVAATSPTPTPSVTPSVSTAPTGVTVPIISVTDFDPAGNGAENHDQVGLAVDGNVATAWHTVQYFKRADLGGLKPGVGLLIDLGSPQRVGAVSLNLVGSGTSLELRGATSYSTQADAYLPLQNATNVGPFVTLRPVSVATVRYLLIWLTSVPKAGVNYQGGIAEIHVYSD